MVVVVAVDDDVVEAFAVVDVDEIELTLLFVGEELPRLAGDDLVTNP